VAGSAFIPAVTAAVRGLWKVNQALVGFVQVNAPSIMATLDMDELRLNFRVSHRPIMVSPRRRLVSVPPAPLEQGSVQPYERPPIPGILIRRPCEWQPNDYSHPSQYIQRSQRLA
jgi:hypothetical protein